MKYVIIEKMGMEVPLMFPDCVSHETFADMNPISAAKFKINLIPMSGEFGDTTNNVITYGESTSLKLKSRPEDADIIQHAFEFEE
jgi:hypothetical protein